MQDNVQNIRDWQQLFQQIHPSVENELIKLALVLFEDAKACEIIIDLPNRKVEVHLKPYSGLKAFYNKYIKRLNKRHLEQAKRLAHTFQFWMPVSQDGKRPVIEIYWT